MSRRFRIHDVTGWEVVNPEPVGREEKVWIRSPHARDDHSHMDDWLFKPVVRTAAGHRQGEDWSEKLAGELGRALGATCAQVELAVRDGAEGSISRNVAPDGWSLVHGSILLGSRLPSYVEGQRDPPGRPGHNLINIMDALRGCAPPPGADVADAPSAFAGYLVLDALIGNQDRHDQNWAVLREASPPGTLRLAASYDHASGLAFQRLDSFRSAKLADRTVAAFTEKAWAQRFEHDPGAPRSSRRTLVGAAREALDLAGPDAGKYWMDRLESVDHDVVGDIVADVPELSDVTRTFTVELVRINRERLLRECR